jgi:hypothetical protein
MSPVTELLEQFSEGQIELDELAAQFTAMQWPQRPRVTPEEAIQGVDPEPDPPGSFAEVEQAFIENKLTAAEYRLLLIAVASGREQPETSPAPPQEEEPAEQDMKPS